LAPSLGHEEEITWAEDACGAVLRSVGTAEPDVVLEVDAGTRGGPVRGLCAFFGAVLLAAGVVAPPGEEFVDVTPADGWIYTTSSEVPADADPKLMIRAVERLRSPETVPANGET
jgi:hypothetical protein